VANAIWQENIEALRGRFASGEFAAPARGRDSIVASWMRSRANGLSFGDRAIFNPISRANQKRLAEKNRDFIRHAEGDMERLFALLRGGDWAVSLIDANGFVLRTFREAIPAFKGIELAFRPGVNLGEAAAGTTGPACALSDGKPAVVAGKEHFLDEAGDFTCTSAPIYDPQARLVGVLNASRRHSGGRDGIPLPVTLAANAIGEQLVRALPDTIVIDLNCPLGPGRPAGRCCLAFDPGGRLVGASTTARQLIDLQPGDDVHFNELFVETFGLSVDRMRSASSPCITLTLHNGLQLFATASEAAPQPRSHSVRPVLTGTGYESPLPPEFDVALSKARIAFDRDIPILINGDTGTGKEIVSRHLHQGSRRAKGPFIALNCSSIPANLIESELFGYEPGAFTGAARNGMPGKLELANGGTLFLDEIGDMPIDLQARLLRVLQERKVVRVGSHTERELDFALISATHRDLSQEIARGLFREDLYYRVNGLRLVLPSLSQRADFDRVVDRIVAEESSPAAPVTLGPAARQMLRRHAWPGNLRELRQVLKLACAMADDGVIEPAHLPPEMTPPSGAQPTHDDSPLEQAEREVFAEKFAAHRGNISALARTLGIARATAYKKLRDYQLI
jgi:transcriptional regulator of acetoin/glycerol metabolism